MSDPSYRDPQSDPRSSPPRAPYERQPRNSMAWVIGAFAALAVIAALVWSMRDHRPTASNPAPETTGQSRPAPGAPAPSPPATVR
jgi:hypothetical protein